MSEGVLGPFADAASDAFLFAMHNQAIGQFGVTVNAIYTGEAFQ